MPRVTAEPRQQPDDDAPDDDPVVELLEQCLLRVPVEGSSAIDAVCRAHPEHAGALRDALQFLRKQQMVQGDVDGIPERLGEYRLLHRLGGGGMGVVYLAEQASLGRRVAIKLIRPELLWFDGSRARFRREAEAIASLQHPAIVPVHTAGEVDGIPFLVMDHVAGASLGNVLTELAECVPDHLGVVDLAAALQRAAKLPSIPALPFTGPWWRIASTIVQQVAGAVAHAHERGVLHRDLKPSNVMLGPDGRVQLVDFGLARADGDAELTRPGTPLGSLAYMAPEQVLGRADVDGRCDVYGIGVTLYELLTLRSPFLAGDSESTRARILAADVEPPRRLHRAIPRDLEVVCLHAMAPEPERRYRDVAAFASDLANVLAHAPIAARRAGPWVRLVRFRRRQPAAFMLVAVLLFAAPVAIWFAATWLAERGTVRLGENAARATNIATLLERGWTSFRTMPARAREQFTAVLQVEPENTLAVLGACLAGMHAHDDAAVHATMARHATVVARHPMFALLPRMLAFDPHEPFPLPANVAVPASPADWFLVGLAARQRGDLGDRDGHVRALACFDQCIQLSPTPELVFFAYRCDALLALGDRDRARQAVQVLTTRWPDSASALTHAAAVLKGPDPQQAQRLLERALQLDPGEPTALVQLGRLRLMQGDEPGYVTAIERAIALRPDSAEMHTELARARLSAGDVDGSLEAIDEALAGAADDADAHVVQGNALAAADRHDEAFAAWDRAEALAPRHENAFYFRAQLLIRLERHADAAAELRKAITLAPANALTHGSLAIACRRRGDIAGARAAALRASELAPDYAYWRLELAFAQWRLGEHAAAKASLQHVVAALPDHAEAHEVRLRFAVETNDAALQAEERARWQQRGR
jgi:serine/threonine protein kinase/tetratricopeptide (TPR) repeat protein